MIYQLGRILGRPFRRTYWMLTGKWWWGIVGYLRDTKPREGLTEEEFYQFLREIHQKREGKNG